jgi:hypothetical protein
VPVLGRGGSSPPSDTGKAPAPRGLFFISGPTEGCQWGTGGRHSPSARGGSGDGLARAEGTRLRMDFSGTPIPEFAHGRKEDLFCGVLKQRVHEDHVTACQATLDDGADLVEVSHAREHEQR